MNVFNQGFAFEVENGFQTERPKEQTKFRTVMHQHGMKEVSPIWMKGLVSSKTFIAKAREFCLRQKTTWKRYLFKHPKDL